MLIIGLTGGIATGKSTVAEMLEELGAHRVDADKIAREVVEPDKPAWRAIIDHFGPGVMYFDRHINRHMLASIIFKDPKERAKLEEITHPAIKEEIHEQLALARKAGHKVVVLEVPLLFETGLDADADKIVVVVSDESLQIERMKKRDDLEEEEARQRIAAQMSLAEKAKKADYVLYNSGTLDELREQVKALWEEITKLAGKEDDQPPRDFTWSSDNESVATVSQDGVVVPKAPGTAVITVKSLDGKYTDSCTVVVSAPPRHSEYKITLEMPEGGFWTGDEQENILSVIIGTAKVQDLGYKRVRLNIEQVQAPSGAQARLLVKTAKGLFDTINAGCFPPAEGFELAADFRETWKAAAVFDVPGQYVFRAALVDLDNAHAVICEETFTVDVQKTLIPSVYEIVVPAEKPRFLSGRDAGNVLTIYIKAKEINDIGYKRARLNVTLTAKPEDANVELLYTTRKGKVKNAVGLHYRPATGLPLEVDHNEKVDFKAIFDTPGEYTFMMTLVDLDKEATVIAGREFTVTVTAPQSPSDYEIIFKTEKLKFYSGKKEGNLLPVIVRAKTVRELGLERARINVAVTGGHAGAHVRLLAKNDDGTMQDAAFLGYVGDRHGYPIPRDYNRTINFNAYFDQPDQYTVTVTLLDFTGGDARIVAENTVTFDVEKIPEVSTYELFCDTSGLQFFAGSRQGTVLPITLRATEVKDLGYRRVRFNVVTMDAPAGASIQLLGKDAKGRTHNAALLGYFGPANGFAIAPDHEETQNFIAKFDKAGEYVFDLVLTNLEDGSVVASKRININVETAPEVSEYAIDCDYEGLKFVAGSEAGTVLPVTVYAKKVNDYGYRKARFNVVVIRKPQHADVELWAADDQGKIHDAVAHGCWGPANGFPMEKDYFRSIEFTAKFSRVGEYILMFSLENLERGGRIIAKCRVPITVDEEAVIEGADGIALNRNKLTLTAGGMSATLVASLTRKHQ